VHNLGLLFMSIVPNGYSVSIETSLELSTWKELFGREFLIWLWYLAEENSSGFELSTASGSFSVELWLDDRISFESNEHTSPVTIVHRGGAPAERSEAMLSLKNGRFVKNARFGFRVEQHSEFLWNVNAKDLTPYGLQIIELFEDEADDQTFSKAESAELFLEKRLGHVDLFNALFDALFERFSEERRSSQWQQGSLPKIQAWIDARP
jgi:hypothetical protein